MSPAFITERWDASCRVCVDTAPVRERYWAQQAGIGFVGRNNQLILPGRGSYFFLGEIVTDLQVEPDKPCGASCGDCRLCVDACPAAALPGDYGALDARRCISCITIEYRGDFTLEKAAVLGNRVYGCDECQKACPHNRFARPSKTMEFLPSPEFPCNVGMILFPAHRGRFPPSVQRLCRQACEIFRADA